MSKPKLSTPVRILLGVALSALGGLAGAGRHASVSWQFTRQPTQR